MQVRIAARASGAAGQGIVVNVRAEDRGVGGLPSVDSVTGNTISVRINSRAGSQTTVQQFVNALQQNPAANQLVETRLEAGNPNALVGNIDLFAPISLTGGVALADEQIVPGYVGLGDSAGEVVLRFSQPLSQDTYRIEILGQGADPFRNINNQPLNGGNNYALTFSVNRAPQVLSVVPQPIVVESGVRKQRTNEVWVYFDRNDPLDVATANNVNNYSLYFGNNGVLTPTSASYNSTSGVAILRFANDLSTLNAGATTTYRLRVGSVKTPTVAPAVLAPAGQTFGEIVVGTDGGVLHFEPRIEQQSVVVSVQVGAGFNLSTNGTNVSITIPATATLAEIAQQIAGNPNVSALVALSVRGVATDVVDPAFTSQTINLFEIGSSYSGAFDLGTIGAANSNTIGSKVVQSEIDNRAASSYTLDFPGASTEPGNRQIRAEDPGRLLRPVPLDQLRGSADSVDGVSVINYNFGGIFLGDDPNTRELDNDKPYFNLITDAQKQRVREALDLYSQYLGVQFVETQGAGIQIAVGDIYGADTDTSSGAGGLAVATRSDPLDPTRVLGVMDFQDFDQSNDDAFGGKTFRGAMLLVGQLLGYGYSDDLVQSVNSGAFIANNPVADQLYPSPADIIHGQFLYRPDSVDIDMYKFTVPAGGGRVSIETVAERLQTVSGLNTQLRLFRQSTTNQFEEIAANDDYWSDDSQIELDLSAGTYYIGVTASGNNQYDPAITNTGINGRTEGAYELRVSLTPTQNSSIKDATGVALDGDGDGLAGGNFDFWFDAATTTRTAFVDKTAAAGGNGTLAAPYNSLATAIQAANNGQVDVVRILANGGADGRVETAGDKRCLPGRFQRTRTATGRWVHIASASRRDRDG